MKRKLIFLFAGLLFMVSAMQQVSAQYDESANAEASAVIITPIDITKNTDLAFGNIISSGTAGTVTVDFANARTQTNGATFPTVPGTVSSAQFTVTGFSGSVYSITLPADNAVQLEDAAEIGDNMNLTDFVHNATEVLTGGQEVFQVGATLQVGVNQAAGTYLGSFNVIVNYN
jgi:hypothetical protein